MAKPFPFARLAFIFTALNLLACRSSENSKLEANPRTVHIPPLNTSDDSDSDSELVSNRLSIYDTRSSEKAKGVILVGKILNSDDRVAAYFSNFLAQQGYVCVVIESVDFTKVFDRIQTLDDLKMLRHALIHQQKLNVQALDYIKNDRSLKELPIGVLGVSFGAMVLSELYARTPEINAAVLLLAGADLIDIFMTTQEKSPKQARERLLSKIQAHDSKQILVQELKKVGLPEAKSTLELLRSEHSQDLVRVKTNTLLISAIFDRVITRKHTILLWRLMNLPILISMPTGHYGLAYTMPLLIRKIGLWFDEKLRTRPSSVTSEL